MYNYLMSLCHWYPEKLFIMCICFVASSIVSTISCYGLIKKHNNVSLSKRTIVIAGIYFELLFMLTIGCRTPSENWKLIIWPTVLNRDIIIDCFQNVILFVPAGILFHKLFSVEFKMTFVLCAIFSLVIEITQFVFRIGYFETLDIIMNTLGGVVGYSIIQYNHKKNSRYLSFLSYLVKRCIANGKY